MKAYSRAATSSMTLLAGKLLGLDVVLDVQLLQDGNMADLLASHKNDQDRRGTAWLSPRTAARPWWGLMVRFIRVGRAIRAYLGPSFATQHHTLCWHHPCRRQVPHHHHVRCPPPLTTILTTVRGR